MRTYNRYAFIYFSYCNHVQNWKKKRIEKQQFMYSSDPFYVDPAMGDTFYLQTNVSVEPCFPDLNEGYIAPCLYLL